MRLDPAPPAFESNYPTAEFRTKDGVQHGSSEILLHLGQPYNDVGLKIQGYYEGTIRVDSDRCDLGQSYTYTGSKLFEVEIGGEAERSCIIDFSVQPRLPDEERSGETVHEFKGQLVIKVLNDNQAWWGTSSKIKEGLNKRIRVPFSGIGKARVAFRGCDTEYGEELTIKDNYVELSAEEIVGSIQQRTCSLEGAIMQNGNVKRVSWTIWGYAADFPPLPIPAMKTVKFGHTEFVADEAAAVISLDRAYKENHQGGFSYDPNVHHIFRALTAKGRSVICEWAVEKKVWSCRN